MELSSINVRYARALFSLAQEKNLVELIKTDLELIVRVGKMTPEFDWILSNPVIKPSKKIEIIKNIFISLIQPITVTFLEMIVKNKRENQIYGIVRWYLHEYNLLKGIDTATFVTAIPLDEAIRSAVKNIIKAHFNKDLQLIEIVNPDIIGGYILKIDDMQYDGSISSGLKKIRRELINQK
jgi:F-type H+-transporting ATPase subunit delta